VALLCFDLDGTLLDPLQALEAALRAACSEFGLPCPARQEIAAGIGLDPAHLFPRLPPARRREVLAYHDRCFAETGLYQQRVQEGVHALLARLKRQGHRLFLLAGLPEPVARETLHHVDLLLAFDAVVGRPPGAQWTGKRELLERLRLEGYLQSGGYAIGDRAEDVISARDVGLTAIAVTYGFGSRQELSEAKADVLLDSVQNLDSWLEKELRDCERHDPFSRSE
jgi:phosphoglycolate phosphatase